MSSTIPTIPPDVADSARPDFEGFAATWISQFLSALPSAVIASKEALPELIAEIVAVLVELSIELTSEVGKRVGEAVTDFEKTAGPLIEKAAAEGLSDYFGTTITASMISRKRTPGQRGAFAQNLGSFVLTQMFGAFEIPKNITPEVGRENAERILGFNIATTLESWLGKVVSTTPLTKWIPNWADLDGVMQQTLGLGRINRRILGPLLKTLVADPFQWDINKRFTPAIFNAGELVRLLNRGEIDSGEYFEKMSWLGNDQEKATQTRTLLSRLPEKEDVAKLLELGAITPDDINVIFEALGYTTEGAQMMRLLTENDRVRALNNAVESLARDMFRDREIGESELKAMLRTAERTDAEIELIVGIATIERSRPRALPRGVLENAFKTGFIPLSRLSEFYETSGYSLDDRILLEELAVEDRLEAEARDKDALEKAQTTEFRTLPRGQIERAFIDGIISRARLTEYYDGRGFSPADQGVLLELATKRKTAADLRVVAALEKANTPDFAKLPRASIEDAFIRDVVTAGRLNDWYLENGFDPAETPILLSNVRARKETREAAIAAELERANRPDFTDLPRSVIEQAFIQGNITEERLRNWYDAKEFRPAEIPILLELVRDRKAAADAKAAEPPTKPTA